MTLRRRTIKFDEVELAEPSTDEVLLKLYQQGHAIPIAESINGSELFPAVIGHEGGGVIRLSNTSFAW